MNEILPTNRRMFLQLLGGLGTGLVLSAGFGRVAPRTAADGLSTRPIPATGESLPVIGMGSWLTFDVGDDSRARAVRRQVLETFFKRGGAVIDSSPMYGSSEAVIGDGLNRIHDKQALFAATKVWIHGRRPGIAQMDGSRELWGVERFDLMQIHNMLDWETHLDTLAAMKAEGRLRYIGITTSHGRRHEALEQALKSEPFDFVQFTYNLVDREAERRLLPLAAERGMAVIINRPFRGGSLLHQLRNKPLPDWASAIDCASWAQFCLKFIVSHPAVTCAIPATSRVDHMEENMGALRGRLPDERTRQRMIAYIESL
jgi:diketogulonate reductase-like aldo/keto reductase